MPDTDTRLSFSEEFARFLSERDRQSLRDLLKHRHGEYNFLDFKEAWPDQTDLAKHALGFANSGHGCIVVGIAEDDSDSSLKINGLAALKDKTDIKQGIEKYLPSTVHFEIHDFEYEDSDYVALKGKKFQVFLVAHNPAVIPILCKTDGKGIHKNRIYVRKNNSTTEADHDTLQELLQTRIRAVAPSNAEGDLTNHLDQLKALYGALDKQEWMMSHGIVGLGRSGFGGSGLPSYNAPIMAFIRDKEQDHRGPDQALTRRRS